MRVVDIDHLVLTVSSIEKTVDFYERALGMRAEVFGPERRTALLFGSHKINLHQIDRTFEPKAGHPIPGSADLCLLVDSLDRAEETLKACNVDVLVARSARFGAGGRPT